MLHIGQEIKRVIQEKKIKVVDFARQINTDRNNIYDIYQRKSIDTDLLEKISQVLHYDFFALYSKSIMPNNLMHNPEEIKTTYGKESESEIEYRIRKLEERILALEQGLLKK